MNEPGAYDGIDMRGIEPAWYEPFVPVEAQKKVIAYDSACRLVYTQRFKRFIVVHRLMGIKQAFCDGFLRNWVISFPGEANAPLDVDVLLESMREADRWKNHATHAQADRAYNEAADQAFKTRHARVEAETVEPFQTELHDALSSHQKRVAYNNDAQTKREAEADAASGRRDLKRGPLLFVPRRAAAEIAAKKAAKPEPAATAPAETGA